MLSDSEHHTQLYSAQVSHCGTTVVGMLLGERYLTHTLTLMSACFRTDRPSFSDHYVSILPVGRTLLCSF